MKERDSREREIEGKKREEKKENCRYKYIQSNNSDVITIVGTLRDHICNTNKQNSVLLMLLLLTDLFDAEKSNTVVRMFKSSDELPVELLDQRRGINHL